MAKIFGINSQLRGKVGALIYRNTKRGTVVYQAPVRKSPLRSEKQMQLRTQWANLGAVYRQFNRTLRKAFENLPAGMSDYNAFVQANIDLCKVYLSKKESLNGGTVLAPYQISRGSLPSIAYSQNDDNVLVSDIAIGDLQIDQDTTVSSFSAAVIDNNDSWQEGDMITFFHGVQSVDSVTSVPRASIKGFKLVLDLNDTTPLWDIVTPVGFSSINGFIGMNNPVTDGAAAWIHSREDNEVGLQVSTQFLYVDSALLSTYQSNTAFGTSADSYGGINTQSVFLQPEP